MIYGIFQKGSSGIELIDIELFLTEFHKSKAKLIALRQKPVACLYKHLKDAG